MHHSFIFTASLLVSNGLVAALPRVTFNVPHMTVSKSSAPTKVHHMTSTGPVASALVVTLDKRFHSGWITEQPVVSIFWDSPFAFVQAMFDDYYIPEDWGNSEFIDTATDVPPWQSVSHGIPSWVQSANAHVRNGNHRMRRVLKSMPTDFVDALNPMGQFVSPFLPTKVYSKPAEVTLEATSSVDKTLSERHLHTATPETRAIVQSPSAPEPTLVALSNLGHHPASPAEISEGLMSYYKAHVSSYWAAHATMGSITSSIPAASSASETYEASTTGLIKIYTTEITVTETRPIQTPTEVQDVPGHETTLVTMVDHSHRPASPRKLMMGL